MSLEAFQFLAAVGSITMPIVAIVLFVIERKQESTRRTIETLREELKEEIEKDIQKVNDRISKLRIVRVP